MRRSSASGTAHVQQILDVTVKLKGHGTQGRLVSGQRGRVILQRPQAQRFMKIRRPTQPGTLDLQRKDLGKFADQFCTAFIR